MGDSTYPDISEDRTDLQTPIPINILRLGIRKVGPRMKVCKCFFDYLMASSDDMLSRLSFYKNTVKPKLKIVYQNVVCLRILFFKYCAEHGLKIHYTPLQV